MNIQTRNKISPSRQLTLLLMLKPYNISPSFLEQIDFLYARLAKFGELSGYPVRVLLQSEILQNSDFKNFVSAQAEKRGNTVHSCELVFETDSTAKIKTISESSKVKEAKSPPIKSQPKLELTLIKGDDINLVICFGGDGVIFHAHRVLRDISPNKDVSAPVLAVNFGTLGFMSQFLAEDLSKALEATLTTQTEEDEKTRVVLIPKVKFEVLEGGKRNI